MALGQLSLRRKNLTTVPTSHDLAYAAGFFDGEGAVMIWRRHSSGEIDKKGRPYHRLHVSITQTNKVPLEWMQARFGGSIHVKNANPGTNEKPSWHWMCSSQAAIDMLVQIYPYVVMKRERIDVAIEFRQLVALNVAKGTKGWTAIDDELWSKREDCRNRLRKLNKRGLL